MDEEELREEIVDTVDLIVDFFDINNISPSVGASAMISLLGRIISRENDQGLLEDVVHALRTHFKEKDFGKI